MIRGDAAEFELLANASALVRDLRLTADADLDRVVESPPADADPHALKRLRQIAEAGGWVLVESALADLPADLRWLYECGAVSLAELAAAHRALRLTTASDLDDAVQARALRGALGLDPSIEDRIAAALPALRASIPRIPLGRAVAVAEPVLDRLRSGSDVAWALPAGSLRRGQDTVGDVELVAVTTNPSAAIDRVIDDADVGRCLHRSERRVYLRIDRVQVGVRFPDRAVAGAELLLLTGARRHVQALREMAAARGLRLTAAGLRSSTGSLLLSSAEEEIYSELGLPFIPPEIRNGDDELAAARRGTLPTLVSRQDVRGDLHLHSVWSDGRDPVEAMVEGCVALGYEYMAITDHSQSSAASRNLTIEGVKQQAEEIAALRERHPSIQILHGCEVDILENGRLDFPDQVLERFDIVLASLHDRAGHSPEQLMKRYVAAMHHPLVAVITHPTNRMLPRRAGYDLDYDRLFEAAADTRTVMEVDGSPSHLDLDGALARRAVAAGATLVVDSDCHRADLLERQMQLGIMTARRGWVEPRHVLNTRPIGEVRELIASKRGR